jgi:hypothetical protein
MASFSFNSFVSSHALENASLWFKVIRDLFLGENAVSQNIPLALEMAAACDHPDARWLWSVCSQHGVQTKQDAHRVFAALGESDPRAPCLESLFNEDDYSFRGVRRGAELGDPFAMAVMSRGKTGQEAFEWAERGAAKGEPECFYLLGHCYRFGDGCKKDLAKSKEFFYKAAAIGGGLFVVVVVVVFFFFLSFSCEIAQDMYAIGLLGELSEGEERWRWWTFPSEKSHWLTSNFCEEVQKMHLGTGDGNPTIVFLIGRALKGRIDLHKKKICSDSRDFDDKVGYALFAIAFYEAQIKATKDAMHAWTQVGIRWKVVKDVRKLIAKLIWDTREEALYNTLKEIKEEEEE